MQTHTHMHAHILISKETRQS